MKKSFGVLTCLCLFLILEYRALAGQDRENLPRKSVQAIVLENLDRSFKINAFQGRVIKLKALKLSGSFDLNSKNGATTSIAPEVEFFVSKPGSRFDLSLGPLGLIKINQKETTGKAGGFIRAYFPPFSRVFFLSAKGQITYNFNGSTIADYVEGGLGIVPKILMGESTAIELEIMFFSASKKIYQKGDKFVGSALKASLGFKFMFI